MKPPPKVLLSAGMIQGGHSGVGRYVVELANRIAKSPTVHLHVAGLEADRQLFCEIPDRAWQAIPARYANGASNLWWHQHALPSLLRQNGYQLLHIPSYRRIVARSPIPQVATIHDCAPFRMRQKYDWLRGLFGRQVVPRLARRCEQVIAVSQFTGNDLQTFFGLPPERITVIPNGIDHERFKPPSADALARFRAVKAREQPFFLYLSRIEHPGKNHLNLIAAFERFREQNPAAEHHLVLAGADWHGAEDVHERARQSPFAADIALPGFVAEAEIPLWYAAADALVFPSLMEGFGLPVVEAMACGTPVACSDVASLPEVGGEAAIFFDPRQPESIAGALSELVAMNPAQRDHRRQLGFAQAGRFHWDHAAKCTTDLYTKLLVPK